MVSAVKATVARFRKKYTLVLLMFFSGTVMAFADPWTAEEYRWFCVMLLAIFGPMDLADNRTLPWGKRKDDA